MAQFSLPFFIRVDSSFPGTHLLFSFLVVEVLCVLVLCGSLKILRTKILILFAISWIVQLWCSCAKFSSVVSCTLSWLLALLEAWQDCCLWVASLSCHSDGRTGAEISLLILRTAYTITSREPLSNVPVDLLFLHLVLPYTVHYFRPKKAIKEVATVVWKFLATRLRLTSYFFGDRHPQEEFTPKNWRDNFIRSGTFVANPDIPPDGFFRRVPATDNLALPRDMRATVAVTANGEPVDDAARALMLLQNAEVEKAKHNIQEDYTIVYIPPNFRW